jgi:very-short-patch-repair endonuclease
VQFPVQDDVRRRAAWLDLAYPEQRIGIEYEGADHTRPERVLLDAARYTRLVDAGWRIYRFTKYQVYAEPEEIVATVGRALDAR